MQRGNELERLQLLLSNQRKNKDTSLKYRGIVWSLLQALFSMRHMMKGKR